MIVVDSSVWIDYFNGKKTPQTDWLDSALGNTLSSWATGLTEVLQDFKAMRISRSHEIFSGNTIMAMGDVPWLCRVRSITGSQRKGVTVRKTIDVMIGTFCIHYRLPLLHDDRDFDPMVKFLGLKTIET